MADANESPGTALANKRWGKASKEDKLAVGAFLAEARRKARLAREKKRKKAKRR